MPPRHSALGELCAVGAALEKKQMPLRLSQPLIRMLRVLGAHMPFAMRLLLGRVSLTKGLVLRVLSGQPATNAMVRTTTAVTMASGSAASNVLPQSASLTVNFCLLPGDTVEDVTAHVRRMAGKEAELTLLRGDEASAVSPMDTTYEALCRVVCDVFPGALTVPYMMPAGTDAIRYEKICSHIYRFGPFEMDEDMCKGIYGTNERIAIESLGTGVQFFKRLLETI